jgi:hypothetical protein
MIHRRAASFSIDRDFPQAALLRVYNAGVKDLEVSPDIIYGAAFEKLMKRLAVALWQDIRIETSAWIFISWTNPYALGEAEGAPLKDCYKLFVLTSVDINEFKKQFEDCALLVQGDKADVRAQSSAFNNFTRTSIWEKF